jgi:hypothetical protein
LAINQRNIQLLESVAGTNSLVDIRIFGWLTTRGMFHRGVSVIDDGRIESESEYLNIPLVVLSW